MWNFFPHNFVLARALSQARQKKVNRRVSEPCKKNDPFTSTSSKVNLEASRVDADLTTVFLNVLATKVGHSFVIFLFQTDQKVAAKNVM